MDNWVKFDEEDEGEVDRSELDTMIRQKYLSKLEKKLKLIKQRNYTLVHIADTVNGEEMIRSSRITAANEEDDPRRHFDSSFDDIVLETSADKVGEAESEHRPLIDSKDLSCSDYLFTTGKKLLISLFGCKF